MINITLKCSPLSITKTIILAPRTSQLVIADFCQICKYTLSVELILKTAMCKNKQTWFCQRVLKCVCIIFYILLGEITMCLWCFRGIDNIMTAWTGRPYNKNMADIALHWCQSHSETCSWLAEHFPILRERLLLCQPLAGSKKKKKTWKGPGTLWSSSKPNVIHRRCPFQSCGHAQLCSSPRPQKNFWGNMLHYTLHPV